MRSARALTVVCVIGLGASSAIGQRLAPTYSVRVLEPLTGMLEDISRGWAINELGGVSGDSEFVDQDSNLETHVTYWDALGAATDVMGPLGPDILHRCVDAVNSAREIVGFFSDDGVQRAFYFDGETFHINSHPAPKPDRIGRPFDINEAGQFAGFGRADTPFGERLRAVLWSSELEPTELPNLGGEQAFAFALNENGDVAMESEFQENNPRTRAARWSDGKLLDLGQIPGADFHRPLDINNKGDVVGYSTGAGVESPMLFTDADGLLPLADFGSANGARASAINDQGVVVGHAWVDGVGQKAVVWVDQRITRLDTLLINRGGFQSLTFAPDINERGQITGNGPWGAGLRGFVLTPCLADYNRDRTVDSDDFFAFLDGISAGDPNADLDHDNDTDSKDFFLFLDSFSDGCG